MTINNFYISSNEYMTKATFNVYEIQYIFNFTCSLLNLFTYFYDTLQIPLVYLVVYFKIKL